MPLCFGGLGVLRYLCLSPLWELGEELGYRHTVDDVPAVYRGYVLVVRYAGVLSRYTVPTGSSVLCTLVLNEGRYR